MHNAASTQCCELCPATRFTRWQCSPLHIALWEDITAHHTDSSHRDIHAVFGRPTSGYPYTKAISHNISELKLWPIALLLWVHLGFGTVTCATRNNCGSTLGHILGYPQGSWTCPKSVGFPKCFGISPVFWVIPKCSGISPNVLGYLQVFWDIPKCSRISPNALECCMAVTCVHCT